MEQIVHTSMEKEIGEKVAELLDSNDLPTTLETAGQNEEKSRPEDGLIFEGMSVGVALTFYSNLQARGTLTTTGTVAQYDPKTGWVGVVLDPYGEPAVAGQLHATRNPRQRNYLQGGTLHFHHFYLSQQGTLKGTIPLCDLPRWFR